MNYPLEKKIAIIVANVLGPLEDFRHAIDENDPYYVKGEKIVKLLNNLVCTRPNELVNKVLLIDGKVIPNISIDDVIVMEFLLKCNLNLPRGNAESVLNWVCIKDFYVKKCAVSNFCGFVYATICREIASIFSTRTEYDI